MGNKEQKKIVGEAISLKRLDKKLTQRQVSDFTGLSRNYISDIENGRYMPSVDALTKLARCLDLDLNFLLSMTEMQYINKDKSA